MEQINQLKAMRDAARARIEATPDYKLMTSLDALIADLEAAFGAPQPKEPQQGQGGGASGPAGPAAGGSPSGQQGGPAVKAEGNGAAATGILNGKTAKAANAEEDAIDQAVAELEAELVSAAVPGDRQ